MMFFLGVIPFLIFGYLINAFDRQFRIEIDRAIGQGQEEEDRRTSAILTKMAEDAVRQKALDVALQLELYLKANPELTTGQLRNTPVFREIAIQPVLQTGYTAVFNRDTAVTFFHRNPDLEGTDLSLLANELSDFWGILKQSLGGKYSHGYYQWKDADGKHRTKYMYIAPIGGETADRVRLSIAATVYVEEFTRPIKISRDVSHGTSRFLSMTFQRLVGASRNMGFLFFGVGLAVNLFLAFWAGIYFARTITLLRGATRSVINGNLKVRVASTMTGDVGELTEDFNRMVAHLETTTVRKEALESKQTELTTTNRLLQQEVSDRKNAEAALRESEDRLRAIIETNPNPIVVYDHQGHPDYLNMAFTVLFGWSLNELKGKHIPFVPDDLKASAEEKIEELYRSQKVVSLESQRITRHGDCIDVLISAAPFKRPDKESPGMVVNFTDITEIKELKAQLQHAQKMEAIGTLAGGIAHNFNNVLMGIQGITSLMLMEKSGSHPDCSRLKAISDYCQSATGLTKDLLAFARGGKYEVKPTDFNRLMQHETGMFKRTRKEISIFEKYEEKLWTVDVDQDQMRQVLMNLYLNAWQAMPEGGELHIQTENVYVDESFIAPFEIKPGRYVKISVTDSGVGMDAETREKIFEPFFSTREMTRGTGLGLASVYGIIKNHNGFIDVYSEKSKGTTFDIYLPSSSKAIEMEKVSHYDILKGSETILLVDDEEMITDVGGEILEMLGYNVLTARNGKEAVDLYEKKIDEIDFVILDMIMPGISSGETYDLLKRKNPEIRVLLASGYSLNGRAEEIMARGCNGFIQKPFNIEDLSQKIRKILDA